MLDVMTTPSIKAQFATRHNKLWTTKGATGRVVMAWGYALGTCTRRTRVYTNGTVRVRVMQSRSSK